MWEDQKTRGRKNVLKKPEATSEKKLTAAGHRVPLIKGYCRKVRTTKHKLLGILYFIVFGQIMTQFDWLKA